MKTIYPALALALATATISVPAAEVDISKLPPPSAKTGLTFEKDIQPLFESSCVQCHGEVKPKENLRLDSLAGVLKGSKHGKVIVPGKSEKSSLIIAISRLDKEMAMPPEPRPAKANAVSTKPQKPTPKPLTAEQVGIVRAWIDQGAN